MTSECPDHSKMIYDLNNSISQLLKSFIEYHMHIESSHCIQNVMLAVLTKIMSTIILESNTSMSALHDVTTYLTEHVMTSLAREDNSLH